ncbi:MAG: glycoside hydrolase family 99-like domain-containing protein [Tardiphaga sp.]
MHSRDCPGNISDYIDGHFGYASDSSDHIRSLSPVKIPDAGARLVAYYLPQFHPTDHNNRWWGTGFTEWTNVTKAVPQFVGHYQPRLPGELGFYDLRLPEVQEQQVALAKQAGLSAFCFYFYWFMGRTLLETPVRNFADNANIDFEFCLCWANEDWTRSWTGNNNDVLIEQHYDPADDIAFIAHLACYLKNPKYLRIDGRPLITVWRPSLLPDAAATVQRWRDWCMDNGIGPIHVAYSQTFEKHDPRKFGMDSAIQFPPGDTRWTEPHIARYEGPVALLNRGYRGELFDYRDLVRRAHDFVAPDYQLFRAVCPSWDNEARRPGRGRTLVGASPQAYLEYLETSLKQTVAQAEPANRLVFINAWNEWGEGAHLEPDRRFGLGYLEATRMACLRVALQNQDAVAEPERLAVVVHVYYEELIDECMGWLAGLTIPHDVFVTVHDDGRQAVEAFLGERGLSATIFTVDNRGRDIAPFVDVLQSIDLSRYGRVLKLHTKMSKHGIHGHAWRQDLLETLADAEHVQRALRIMQDDPRIGILGPSRHMLSIKAFLGANEPMVRRLAGRMGIGDFAEATDAFFAGSMFLARTRALLPLAALGLVAEDFEPEHGQINGTLAHAIERAISYSAEAAGLRIAAFHAEGDAPGELVSEGRTAYPYVVRSLQRSAPVAELRTADAVAVKE